MLLFTLNMRVRYAMLYDRAIDERKAIPFIKHMLRPTLVSILSVYRVNSHLSTFQGA